MMRLRVRFLRSRSSSPVAGGPAPAGRAMVRPVVVGTAWVAPTAANTVVTPGSPASTGRPSANLSRSARSSSAEP